jgi:hypothetical protein
MKTLLSLIVTGTLMTTAVLAAENEDQEKTAGQKASDAWQTTKQTTKEAAHAVAKTTKNAADAVVETLTPDKDARHVQVSLSRSSIDMPTTLKPGKTAFVVKNVGKEKENFGITGEDIDREFVFALSPQETKTLQATLKRGHYKAYCTAKDDKSKRTEVNLKVR